MVSDQFKKDYRQMIAQGVTFTPEDIVRLNALAIKVRLSRNAARSTHLPRLAFLPKRQGGLAAFLFGSEIVLREPTIAHEMWIEQAQRHITVDSDRTFDLLYGYALSRPAEKLPDAFEPRKLVRKVFTFAARNLVHLTREQLASAVDYVLFGADWTACERGPVERTGQPDNSPVIGLLTEARALRLPISLEDAKRMTASELDEAIVRCLSKDMKIDLDAAHRKAMGEYVKARNEIRRRSSEATTATSGEALPQTPSNGSSREGESQ